MAGTDDSRTYVWISRWGDFQHYKPERDRGPAWIKDYTKQMLDASYLQLSDRQRALLRDLRDVFAMTAGRVPDDSAVIARYRHQQTRRADLDRLNDAGFIQFVSRATLDQRLEKLYASRAPARSSEEETETEVEKDQEQEPSLSPTEARDPDDDQPFGANNGRTDGAVAFDYQNILQDMPL